MGYRYPDEGDAEGNSFSAQFEWESQQLLSRRNRRDAPVQVRPEERDFAIDCHDMRGTRARIAIATATAGAVKALADPGLRMARDRS